MPPEWIIHFISIGVGLAGGFIGAYIGMKVGMTRLEIHMEDVRAKLSSIERNEIRYNEDILILDLEMEDAMRKLDIPRKRRQNWRFDIKG